MEQFEQEEIVVELDKRGGGRVAEPGVGVFAKAASSARSISSPTKGWTRRAAASA